MSKNNFSDQPFIDKVRQAAHDLGSPLSVLNVCLIALPKLPQEKRLLFKSVIRRIQKIAQDILKAPYEGREQKPVLQRLSQNKLEQMLEDIISEKQIEYHDLNQIEIKKECHFSGGLFEIHVDENDLCRILSNLVNNAMESFTGKGFVKICLYQKEKNIFLEVQDNGKGIAKDLLPYVTGQGQSFGKKGGCGLGLFHAKTTVESWGGSLEVLSREHRGTTIKISFPIFHYPVHFSKKISSLSDKKGVHHE